MSTGGSIFVSANAVVLVIAAFALAVVIWLGRYEIIGVPAGNHGIAYRLDRWTGQVVYIVLNEAGVAEIK